MRIKRWNMAALDTAQAADLAEACEIHPFLSLLLTSRGMDTPEQVYAFLLGLEEEVDPYAFADMAAAVKRIHRALEQKERILIYGDYDVDGLTATALLVRYLRQMGGDVLYRVPLREEGYGLHPAVIHWAVQQGVTLVVTVDTGVTAVEEADLAARMGVDLVVTDHHHPGAQLPCAVAVVDPHREDCESGCRDFAGVGVAFMLACALEGDGERIFREYGDLLTLGTLADIMPLQGINRDFMRRGILLLEQSRLPGLVALREVAGLQDKTLTAGTISFGLVPRLNAAGRMGDPHVALQLLLTDDAEEAQRLAQEIQQINAQRQQAGSELYAQAEALLAAHPDWLYDRVLVLAGENWHGGLLGLVAARMLECYGKPTIVLSLQPDGVAHGSGRSLEGFSLYAALQGCENCLTTYGGHDLAAGMTLPVESVDAFRRTINAYAAERCPTMPVPALDIALRIRPDQIHTEKLELLQVLEPFGSGNPAPLFGLFRMRLDNIAAVGGGKHLRLSLSRDGVRINAVKFQTAPELFPVPCGSVVNCVVSLEPNEYRGNLSVTVRVRDISFADSDRDQLIEDVALFDCILRQETTSVSAELLPDRDLLARLYTLLRTCKQWNGTPEQLQHALGDGAPRLLQILLALELWQQAGLVRWQDRGERVQIDVLPVTGKADLTATPLWRYLKGDEENA